MGGQCVLLGRDGGSRVVAAVASQRKARPVDAQKPVRIELTLVPDGGKAMDPAPNGVSIGAVQLRDWQVDRVEAQSGMYEGFDVHLIRINYELELEPGLPGLPWFEVAFEFVGEDGEGKERVSVIDALPLDGMAADVPKAYGLNGYLNFMPVEDGATAHAMLPAGRDRVDMFGVGGQCVRWRHVSLGDQGVRPGSYRAWVVLLTTAGRSGQEVEFSARYDLAVGADSGYWPTQQSARFRLALMAPTEGSVVVKPSASVAATARDQSVTYHPSAFICYAHDSDQHKVYARRFGEVLVRNGVDVRMDQWDGGWRKDWATWACRLINSVDFIIVLASPICRAAFDGELDSSCHQGIQSEAALITQNLHRFRDQWTRKVLPVALPNERLEHIPRMLLPWTVDHYDITRLDTEGIDDLLRAMTGVARYARPPLGSLPLSVLRPLAGSEH